MKSVVFALKKGFVPIFVAYFAIYSALWLCILKIVN